MAPKFGNYLFRNLKGQSGEQHVRTSGNQSEALGNLEEQTILLQAGDLDDGGKDAPPLDWTKVGNGTIAIQLKDTEGILEGRVTVSASVLRRVSPNLFSELPSSEYLYPVSLKTVVLQIQAHLKRYQGEKAKFVEPDFDTPIAQVAREDEGFFKLEENVRPLSPPEPSKISSVLPTPSLTPADHPLFPLIREKPMPQEAPIEQRTATGPVEVSVHLPNSREDEVQAVKDQKVNTSRKSAQDGEMVQSVDLESGTNPAVRSLLADLPLSEPEGRAGLLKTAMVKPLQRLGLERLQEIFLTEDLLDAHEVAKRIKAFPKVKAVLLLFRNQTILGGELPPGYAAEAVVEVPDLLRKIQLFTREFSGGEVAGLTILGDVPISLFSFQTVSMLLIHEGRGLLPGMRERMNEVVSALHLLYEGSNP